MELSEEYTDFLSFSVSVPEDAAAVKFSILNSPADLDIFINYEEPLENYDSADLFGISEDYNEELFFTRFSDNPLQKGTYFFDIAYQRQNLPEKNGDTMTKLPFSFQVDIIQEKIEAELVSGEKFSATLYPETGMFTTFTCTVPEGTPALRLDITDAVADLDLLVRKDDFVRGYGSADYVAESLLSRESILITGGQSKDVSPGTYYITVLDQVAAEYPVNFTIFASLSRDAPGELLEIGELPVPRTFLQRVLYSTVEIIGDAGKGSGCIVSPEGIIVTNYHVVRGSSGASEEFLNIAVTTDTEVPPTEQFRAKVIDTDEEKDLALLKITSGLYGQPLPEDYVFPYLLMNTEIDYGIGDPVYCAGYPGIGGTGSRASISFTGGIISGFERTSYGTLLKTDGLINSGSSGGAAVDERFRLIGLPSIIMEEASGQLGFILPVSLFPKPWLEIIAGAQKN